MASSSADLNAFLKKNFGSSIPADTSEADIPNLSQALYPTTTYTDTEKVEIFQWITTSSRLAVPDEDEAKHLERLGSLNIHLSTRTTLLGSKPSVADIALYFILAPTANSWTAEQRTGERGYHHIVRHIDFVQNAPIMGLKLAPEEKVAIDPNHIKFVIKPLDPKEEKERKKKEKAAAAAATGPAKQPGSEKTMVVGQRKNAPSTTSKTTSAEQNSSAASTQASTAKREKKEKAPKQTKAPAPKAEVPLSPSLIDLRVGHILRAIPHPNADSLYVSTVACGDAPGTDNTSTDEATGQVVRTVCSGLNGLIPLSEMQDRKIIAVCNLKPVTMRGVKSAAMVLAASPRPKEGEAEDGHKGPVELVEVPEGAQAGDRVNFEGWEGEPEGMLNPKKKFWETLQPGFGTDEEGRVGFDRGSVEALKSSGEGVGFLKTKSGGICKVKSLKGATVR